MLFFVKLTMNFTIAAKSEKSFSNDLFHNKTNLKIDIDLARNIALILTVIAFYLLLVLLYHSYKNGRCQNGSAASNLCLLIAVCSVLLCVNRLAELWTQIISCETFHLLSTSTYGIGLGLVYTTLWIRQHRLYSDKVLKQTVSKFSRSASSVCIVVIYLLLVSVFVSFFFVLKFEGDYPPCHVIHFHLESLLPLLLLVSFSCFSLQLVLFILILYPLRNEKSVCSILCCSEADDEVFRMLKRLAFCAMACVFSTVLLCIAILLDTLEIICIYWGNLVALDLLVSCLSTVFSFKDWDRRLFPFWPRVSKKQNSLFKNSVIRS